MPVQLTFKSPAGQRTVALESSLTVGRDPECDVHIDSVRLSRRHAEFTLTSDGVVVRDLGSRNGVLVNGARVEEERIDEHARVLLGDVAVSLSGARARAAAAPAAGDAQPTGTTRRVSASAPVQMSPAAAPPAFDKTTLLPKGTAARLERPGSVAAPEPGAGTATAAARGTLAARVTFGHRLLGLALLATVLSCAAAACPLAAVARQTASADAAVHAATLLNMLVAENRAALADGQPLEVSVRSVLAEPGVRGALILGTDGRVLAPPGRLDERLTVLPGIGDIATLTGSQTTRTGNQFQAATLVTNGDRRAAILWVTFDPAYAQGISGSPGLVVLTAFLVSAVLGLAVVFVTRRMMATRLDALALEIELAASGQLDRMTARPDLPNLNRAIESLNDAIQRGRAPERATPAAPAIPDRSESAVSRGGPARLTIDGSFIVHDATGDTGRLLGSDAGNPVGRHVLEVTKQQPLLDAIIDCLSALGDGASAQRDVAGQDTPVRTVTAERRAESGQIVLTLLVG